MSLYRDDAVVLRVQKLGEADRIVSLLTRRNGRIRAVGKGVRRTTSRFGSRLEPATYVDVQCYTGRTLDVVTQAETIAPYGARLVDDYGRHTAAMAILETAERLTEEREPALKLYLLTIGALRTLCEREHDPTLVLDAYLLRSMAVAGWEPALDGCARCGRAGPHRHFSVPAGGVVCPTCRPSGSGAPSSPAVALMLALLTGDWATADPTPEPARREASGLVAAHLQWHLERSLRSLPLVDRR
ncbi:MAG: DNA repair protein RecO [Pseudonocardiales bacterium]|nr:MAG: DNA repair protein RecO [Pseudonocardiales bacterium]